MPYMQTKVCIIFRIRKPPTRPPTKMRRGSGRMEEEEKVVVETNEHS